MPILLPVAGSGVTLTQIRRYVAPRLGSYAQGTATSGSTTALMEATAWPFKSSLTVDDLYVDHFLFRPAAVAAADKMRLIGNAGYTPSTGQLTPDQAWTNAPYASGAGETFELHGVVPPISDGSGTNDLHFLINEALKDCLVIVEFTFSPSSATAQQHSLATAASWLEEPAWVRRVGCLAASDVRADTDPYRSPVRCAKVKRTNTVYLEGFSRATTDVVYVEAMAPAYAFCAAAATPTTYTQSGLNAEGDVCLPHLEWIGAATLLQAWTRLGTILAAGDSARADRELTRAVVAFNSLTDQFLTAHLPQETATPLPHWGPLAGGYRGGYTW